MIFCFEGDGLLEKNPLAMIADLKLEHQQKVFHTCLSMMMGMMIKAMLATTTMAIFSGGSNGAGDGGGVQEEGGADDC